MLLSIITINYNDKPGLEKTILSVVNQTFTDYEYIIIDGGSSDGSKELIERFSHKLSYWVSEPDKGIYNAMNKGILKAKGEYLLFLNSGDFLLNDNTLQRVSEYLKSDKDIYYGNLLLAVSNKIISFPKKLNFGFFYKKIQSLPHPASFIKRELFNKIFFYDEGLKIVSDWEFFIVAICKYGVSYQHMDYTITSFDEDGLSSNYENIHLMLQEREHVLKKHFSLFIQDYNELFHNKNLLNQNRFKMLKELEQSVPARKIVFVILNTMLFLFKGKTYKKI